MEHAGEVWQELDFTGERLGGIVPAELDEDKVKLFYGTAVMLYRFKDGEVEYLFQHRSKFLKGNPDKWDTSAGGHINLGEPRLDAVVRETREEIGVELDKSKLELVAGYLRHEQDMFVELFFYDFTGREDEFSFDDREVEEVKWVRYGELDDFWPRFKDQIKHDEIFRYCLGEWNIKILKKYENY